MGNKVCVISAYAYIVEHVNYGSLLQYYALERVLDQLGYEAYWLRFILPRAQDKKDIRTAIKNALYKGRITAIANTLEGFQTFISKYLRVSEREYTEEDLVRKCPVADAYITGSDQVWGGTLSPNYLCFVDDKHPKISYAASFGKSQITEEHKATIAPWLRRLDSISVREPSGVQICQEINMTASLVLDPTLLLEKRLYPIDLKKTKDFGDYYFAYFLNVSKKNVRTYLNVIDNIEDHLGKVLITAGVSEIDRFISKGHNVFCTPEEWLGMYSASKGIITNTFHGTVFAIIFRKQFLVFVQNGSTSEQNERIYSLLEILGMKDRIYSDDASIQNQMNRPIDWEHVENICHIHKKESLEFLNKALKGVK